MKKILIISVATFLAAFLFTSGVYAQQANGLLSVVTKTPYENDLDAHFFATTHPFAINTMAVRNFTHSFKEAENVKWQKAKDGLVAFFTENGIKMRANYDSKGNWLYNMRSYNEMNLPKEIRAQVKSIYYDYTITGVNEITKEQKIVYLVYIKDKNHWKTIRVCEGEEIETVEELEEN